LELWRGQPHGAETRVVAKVKVQVPVELAVHDLGVPAPHLLGAFVEAVPREIDALPLEPGGLAAVCACTMPNWKLPDRPAPNVMWPGPSMST
jgi:hypothetical protein